LAGCFWRRTEAQDRSVCLASVQGGCMGGGFELALGCDLIIAGRSASFAFPEGLVGILTLQGGVYNIAERIGRTKAIKLAFLSEPVSAEQMAQWNVITASLRTSHTRRRQRLLPIGSPRGQRWLMRQRNICCVFGNGEAFLGRVRLSTIFPCRCLNRCRPAGAAGRR
jgi:1,4-dihydroxy-2-naphthoyl-CoA synthase